MTGRVVQTQGKVAPNSVRGIIEGASWSNGIKLVPVRINSVPAFDWLVWTKIRVTINYTGQMMKLGGTLKVIGPLNQFKPFNLQSSAYT